MYALFLMKNVYFWFATAAAQARSRASSSLAALVGPFVLLFAVRSNHFTEALPGRTTCRRRNKHPLHRSSFEPTQAEMDSLRSRGSSSSNLAAGQRSKIWGIKQTPISSPTRFSIGRSKSGWDFQLESSQSQTMEARLRQATVFVRSG